MSWEAFTEWYVHYSYEILADERQDHEERLFAFLETHLGDVSKLIRDKLGERYSELTELDLLLEAEGVTVMGQEGKIGAENMIVADKGAVMKQHSEQEAAKDIAGKAAPELEEDMVEKKANTEEDTVTRGSGAVLVSPSRTCPQGSSPWT